MDILTKYRPVRSLEFYQRKVIRFMYSAEGSDDLKSLGIPFGELGFASPLHFIRCIPPEMCEDFVCDRLFQRMDKTLRKGSKVFLVFPDGRIQSATYRGQKTNEEGVVETILEGHRTTYPLDHVVPYKAFLRRNVGVMLQNENHKVTGVNVEYQPPQWNVGDSVFYKPSKRWAVIEDTDLIRGKMFYEIRLEPTSVKKEKLLKVTSHDLKTNSVPYKIPMIPKNNANVKPTEIKSSSAVKPQNIEKKEDRKGDTINRNKLSKQISKESESNKVLDFSSGSSSEDSDYNSEPKLDHPPPEEVILVDLSGSPKPKPKTPENDQSLTEVATASVQVRRTPSKSMRPLTEYFHSHSVDIDADVQTPTSTIVPEVKSKSVSNLVTQVSEDEELTFEKYSDSLRRSARNVLERQISSGGSSKNGEERRRATSTSGDNFAATMSTSGLQQYSGPSYPYHPLRSNGPNGTESSSSQVSTSANEYTSGSESPLPPPLPASMPPLQTYEEFIEICSPDTPWMEPVENKVEPQYLPNIAAMPSASQKYSSQRSNSLSEQYHIYHQMGTHEQPVYANTGHAVTGQLRMHHATSVPSFADDHTSPRFASKGSNPQIQENPNGKGMSTIERQRYRKNPAMLKTKTKSVPNIVENPVPRIMEEPLPPPFNAANVKSASGKGRGIQTGSYSCYADITLMSLFYCYDVFDPLLAFDLNLDRGMKVEVKRTLKEKIIRPLRLSAFCNWDGVRHLREAMLPLSSKLNSSYMDAEEFLYLLFENALNSPPFIQYSNGTKDMLHQIIVRPKDRSKCQDMQFLLETSMDINSLKFSKVPSPALMLCMSRCNGRLVYYEAIIPSMRLNITPLIDKGPKKCLCEMAATLECAICQKKYGEMSLAYCSTCQRLSEQIHYHIGHNPVLVPKQQRDVVLSLMAVICIKNNYYSAFIKTGIEKNAPWLYYEANPNDPPEIKLLEDFGWWLDKLEREPGRYKEYARAHTYIKRIITEGHVCVYFDPNDINRGAGQKESFLI